MASLYEILDNAHGGEGLSAFGRGQKSAVSDYFGSMTVGCSPQARTCTRDHSFEQRRPPLSRRRSPNRPSLNCSSNILAPQANRSASHRITQSRRSGMANPAEGHSVAPRDVCIN
jgi:hypothetical protein